MFSKRNGEPFPMIWWILAFVAAVFCLVTVILLLAAIWLLSWQALATGVVLGILGVIAAFVTFYWADDMS